MTSFFLLFMFFISSNVFCLTTGNVNFFVGIKNLDEADWEPVEKQNEYGVLVDFKQNDWPISIAIDALLSKGEKKEYDSFFGTDVKYEAEIVELGFGVRKIIKPNSILSLSFGGGIAAIQADIKLSAFLSSASDDDKGVGFWADFGAFLTVGEEKVFNIGLNIRYSDAEVEIADSEGEAGGRHIALIFGFHW